MKDSIEVPLQSRRQQRVLLVQKLQHVLPAVVLLGAGVQEFTGEPHGWALVLATVEIVVGLAMLAALAKTTYESRHLLKRKAGDAHAHHTHAAVEWENFIAAALVLAEGWEHRMHGGDHFPRPAILTAAVLIVSGLFNGPIMRAAARRRSLRVTDQGVYIPGRRFKARKIQAAWNEIASIDIGDRWAVVKTRGGRQRKIDLADVQAEAAARHALAEARARWLAAADQ